MEIKVYTVQNHSDTYTIERDSHEGKAKAVSFTLTNQPSVESNMDHGEERIIITFRNFEPLLSLKDQLDDALKVLGLG